MIIDILINVIYFILFCFCHFLSKTMSNQYLVGENGFEFLYRLGVEKSNYGVFANKWTGNGEVRII